MEKGHNLTDYTSARAFLAWVAGVFAIFFAMSHYGLVPQLGPSDPGSGHYLARYLHDVIGRTLKDPFCLPMALVLIGSLGYAISLLMALGVFSARFRGHQQGGRNMRPSYFYRLVGLPQSLASVDGAQLLVSRGAAYATAPLRDAVTLFPATGFLGTVVGITIALGGLQKVMAKGDSSEMMQGLLTAFDTTFIGLAGSMILTLVLFAIDATLAQVASLTDTSFPATASTPLDGQEETAHERDDWGTPPPETTSTLATRSVGGTDRGADRHDLYG